MIIGILVCVLLLGAGAGIKYFKWYWLIAGYNILSEEKKEKINIEKIASYLGNMLFILSVVLFVTLYLDYIGNTTGFIVGLSIFTLLIIFTFFKIQRMTLKQAQKQDKKSIILMVIVALIGIGSIVIVLYGMQSVSIKISSQYININGIYGIEISLNEIENVSLKNDIPNIEGKINGFNAGSIRKGRFKLNSIGEGEIFLENEYGPFIFIETQSEFYIINQKDKKETQRLYEEITKKGMGK